MSEGLLYFLKFVLLVGCYGFMGCVLLVQARDLSSRSRGSGAARGEGEEQADFWLELEPGGERAVAGELVIGRAPACSIQVQDPFASAFHVRVVPEGDGLRVTDLASSNGTFLDRGVRLTAPTLLKNGESFHIGDVRVRVKKKSRPQRLTFEAFLLLGAQGVVLLALALMRLGVGGGGASPWLAAGGICLAWWGTYAALRFGKVRGDPILLPLACFLSGLGWVEVYRIEPELGLRQAAWIIFGCLVMVAVCLQLRDYRKLEHYKYLYLFVGVALQLGVMLFGVERNGARLWFEVGSIQFQPVEIVKLLMILFLAAFLRQFRQWIRLSLGRAEGQLPLRALVLLGLGWAVSIGVLVLQRDLGMALLFFGIFLCMFYLATGRLDLICGVFATFVVGAWFGYRWFGHVQIRVQAWLDPFAQPDTGGYQILQALYALAWGGWSGTGLGMGRPALIPEAATDFIFVALCEELGMFGGLVFLTGFMVLVARVFRASLECNDEFGTLLAAGLGFLFAWQSLILIGGTLKVIPMTGITLPFVSYGGSSMLANFLVLALMQRLSRRGD